MYFFSPRFLKNLIFNANLRKFLLAISTENLLYLIGFLKFFWEHWEPHPIFQVPEFQRSHDREWEEVSSPGQNEVSRKHFGIKISII